MSKKNLLENQRKFTFCQRKNEMIFKDLERKLQNDIGKGIFNENNIEGFVSALNEYL